MSQKEKYKYRILTHIYGIEKNGTEEFIGQQWRNRHREQTYGRGERGGEGKMLKKKKKQKKESLLQGRKYLLMIGLIRG